MITEERKCLLAKNKELCHIHEKKIFKDKYNKLKEENHIIKLQFIKAQEQIDILEKRINKINKSQDYKNKELTNLYKTIEKKNNNIKKKNDIIEKQLETIKELKELNNKMITDYNNYQIIKEYEKQKSDLISKGIDIYNYDNNDFHNIRYLRNTIAHPIVY